MEFKIYSDEIPECPYCRKVLIKFPARKTKCKDCGCYFYIMAKPRTNIYSIVDEKRRTKWIWENKMYSYIDEMKRYGLSNNNLIESEIKRSIKLSDAVWNLYNLCLSYNAGNFKISSWIYYSMAKFYAEEGNNPSKILKLALEFELLSIEQSGTGIVLDAVISSGFNRKCSNCSHLNGRSMPIKDAIVSKLLPHEPCDDSYCTAYYGGRARRDKDGFVITKK